MRSAALSVSSADLPATAAKTKPLAGLFLRLFIDGFGGGVGAHVLRCAEGVVFVGREVVGRFIVDAGDKQLDDVFLRVGRPVDMRPAIFCAGDANF